MGGSGTAAGDGVRACPSGQPQPWQRMFAYGHAGPSQCIPRTGPVAQLHPPPSSHAWSAPHLPWPPAGPAEKSAPITAQPACSTARSQPYDSALNDLVKDGAMQRPTNVAGLMQHPSCCLALNAWKLQLETSSLCARSCKDATMLSYCIACGSTVTARAVI